MGSILRKFIKTRAAASLTCLTAIFENSENLYRVSAVISVMLTCFMCTAVVLRQKRRLRGCAMVLIVCRSSESCEAYLSRLRQFSTLALVSLLGLQTMCHKPELIRYNAGLSLTYPALEAAARARAITCEKIVYVHRECHEVSQSLREWPFTFHANHDPCPATRHPSRLYLGELNRARNRSVDN